MFDLVKSVVLKKIRITRANRMMCEHQEFLTVVREIEDKQKAIVSGTYKTKSVPMMVRVVCLLIGFVSLAMAYEFYHIYQGELFNLLSIVLHIGLGLVLLLVFVLSFWLERTGGET